MTAATPAVPGFSWRKLLFVALLAFCVARVGSYWRFTFPHYIGESDFTPDWVSAREWRAGGDPYAPLPQLYLEHLPEEHQRGARNLEPDQLNPHPPALIGAYMPLSFMGIREARIAVLLLMMVALVAGVALFCRAIGLPPRRSLTVALVVLALPVVEYDLRWAQINGLLLLAFVLAWRGLKDGHDRTCGLILGAITALKVFPIFLLVPLIRMRRYGAVRWTLLTTVALTAAGAIAFGWESTVTFLRVATPRNFEAWGAAPNSISLVSLPFRLFVPDRWLSPGVDVPAYITWLGLLMGALCLVGALRTRAAASRDLWWAAIPWMVLASPIAWPHYLVVVIPLVILLLHNAERLEAQRRTVLFIATAVLAISTTYFDWLQGFMRIPYGTIALGNTMLLCALGAVTVLDLRARGVVSWGRGNDPLELPIPG